MAKRTETSQRENFVLQQQVGGRAHMAGMQQTAENENLWHIIKTSTFLWVSQNAVKFQQGV